MIQIIVVETKNQNKKTMKAQKKKRRSIVSRRLAVVKDAIKQIKLGFITPGHEGVVDLSC